MKKKSNKSIWIGGIIGGIYTFLIFIWQSAIMSNRGLISNRFIEVFTGIISILPTWLDFGIRCFITSSQIISRTITIICFALIGSFIGWLIKK